MSKYFSNGAALQAALQALPAYKTGSFTAFDPFFYGQTYMASYPGELSPIDHFVQIGAARGYKPNATFDPTFYQNSSADLAGLDGADLLYHFMMYGLDEGRVPNSTFANFDGTAYLAANPDVKAYIEANLAQFGGSLTNGAVAHYVKFGAAEGREASGVSSSSIFALTQGLDNIVGTSGNDTINAFAFNVVTGADTTTLQSVDVIDGGAGKDTLNIEVKVDTASADFNDAIQGTIKNVEIININNTAANSAAAVDASKFEGATNINQIGKANNVTNLAATTTAGFQDFAAAAATFNVTPADDAAKVSVDLKNVAEGSTVNVLATGTGTLKDTGTGTLNSVALTGTVVDLASEEAPKDGVTNINLMVTAGKDVESFAVNTSTATTLTLKDGAGKSIKSVDLSVSTGSVDYRTAGVAVASIKGGAGSDKLTNKFDGTATATAATLNGGAGNDTLNVLVTKGVATAVTAAVDAGEGNDTVNLTINGGVTYTVNVGDGNDTVAITNTVKTTDKIDGGAGTDTVSLDPLAATLAADDYIVFNKVLTGFETLKLTNKVTNLDASQLAANYATLDLSTGSIVTKVGTQEVIAHGDVNVEAAGYKAIVAPATEATYAGTLQITSVASGIVTAKAETVNLAVKASANGNGAADNTVITDLAGDAKTATVTLSAAKDDNNSTATTDDQLDTAKLRFTNAAANTKLTSLTISGNGAANVTNGDVDVPNPVNTELVTVDASGLASADIDGKAVAGLTYISNNAKAETIKLGTGLDVVTLNASTYGKMDTVEGLNLVLNTAKTGFDLTKGDGLNIGAQTAAFQKFTTSQTDFDLALKDAAAYEKVAGAGTPSDNHLVFQLGGNTYVFVDAGTDAGLIDAGDTVVKLTGLVDLDVLVAGL